MIYVIWYPLSAMGTAMIYVLLDKTLEMDQPLWIISLDLSKAFDRVNWESLWQAVGDHGASQHLVWILQSLYYQQPGKIVVSFKVTLKKRDLLEGQMHKANNASFSFLDGWLMPLSVLR